MCSEVILYPELEWLIHSREVLHLSYGIKVVCVKCGDDGGCWGYEDLIPTLQTPTVADCSTQHRTICTIGRRRHSDTCLLITATSPGCYCTQMRLTLSGMEGTPLVSRCCARKLSPSLSYPQCSISPPHVTSAARSGADTAE